MVQIFVSFWFIISHSQNYPEHACTLHTIRNCEPERMTKLKTAEIFNLLPSGMSKIYTTENIMAYSILYQLNH